MVDTNPSVHLGAMALCITLSLKNFAVLHACNSA